MPSKTNGNGLNRNGGNGHGKFRFICGLPVRFTGRIRPSHLLLPECGIVVGRIPPDKNVIPMRGYEVLFFLSSGRRIILSLLEGQIQLPIAY